MTPGALGRLLLVGWLAVVWAALWGSFDVGTLVAGALIGAGVTLALRDEVPGRPSRFRPLAALRLAGTFAVMLVQAEWEVFVAVLRPSAHVAPAVVEVALPPTSPMVVTLVSNAITLTPGTITLDAVQQPDGSARLLVHALDASDPEAVRADVLRLHALSDAAFGTLGEARPTGAEVSG